MGKNTKEAWTVPGLVGQLPLIGNLVLEGGQLAEDVAKTTGVTQDSKTKDLGLDQKPLAQWDLAKTLEKAVAELQVYGWSPAQIVSVAKDLMKYSYGEPYSIYQYLDNIGKLSMGTKASDPNAILGLARTLLTKTADPQSAESWFKIITDFARQVPSINALDLALQGGNAGPTLAMTALGLKAKGQDLEIGPILKFINFVQNPNSQLANDLLGYMHSRKQRRQQQQLLELQFGKMITNVLTDVNKELARKYKEWADGLGDNKLAEYYLNSIAVIYRASAMAHALSGLIGVNGSQQIEPQNPEMKAASDNTTNKILRYAQAVQNQQNNQNVNQQQIPPAQNQNQNLWTSGGSGTSGNVQQLATNILNPLDTIKNTQQFQNVYVDLNNILKQWDILENFELSNNKNIETLTRLVATEDSNSEMDIKNIDQVSGMATPEQILKLANTIRQTAKQAQVQYVKSIQTGIAKLQQDSMNASSFLISNPNAKTQLNDALLSFSSIVNAKIKEFTANALRAETFGAWAVAYAPVQKQVSLLNREYKRIEASMQLPEGAAGEMMKFTQYPYVLELMKIIEQMINWKQYGLQRLNLVQLEEQNNPNITQFLGQAKADVARSITELQVKYRNYMLTYTFMDVAPGQGSGLMVGNPLTAGLKQKVITRLAQAEKRNKCIPKEDTDEEKKEDEDENTDEKPKRLYREGDEESVDVLADQKLRDYWNGLLPPNYGDVLDEPNRKRVRKILIPYPKKRRKYKKL